MTEPAPYHFVPVRPRLAVADEPVFHDVQRNDEDHWSGELRCSMTALTPLLAANYQFLYPDLAPATKETYEQWLKAQGIELDRRQQDGSALREVLQKKHVLEPLALPPKDPNSNAAGATLIAGAAIKGMLRQSLQALLSAPMERVAERAFSYRPNLTDARCVKPAIVSDCVRESGRITRLLVRPVGAPEPKRRIRGQRRQSAAAELRYITPDAEQVLVQILARAGFLQPGEALQDLPPVVPVFRFSDQLFRSVPGLFLGKSRLKADRPGRRPGRPADLTGWSLARYLRRADGTFTFAEAFAKQNPSEDDPQSRYSWVLVPDRSIKPSDTPVPLPIVEAYHQSLDHIADDVTGHLRSSHPLSKDVDAKAVLDNIEWLKSETPEPGDLVFLETSGDGAVVGMGHHFRYRRKYRDTIHTTRPPRGDRAGGASRFGHLREVLCPTELECKTTHSPSHPGAPAQLSGARLLFGYVSGSKEDIGAHTNGERLETTLGQEDFKQLAGRIAVNFAVEQLPSAGSDEPDKKGKPRSRFLRPERDHLIPLRPLGEPKASAVEHYLTQDLLEGDRDRADGGTLRTYGDTLDDPAAGDLRGRKFYLHQPCAAQEADCYELIDKRHKDWELGSTPAPVSDQAGLARFVSAPGTTFGFTIRFRDLRGWELGALVYALSPDEAATRCLVNRIGTSKLPGAVVGALEGYMRTEDAAAPDSQPLLAHKLGHGRPLGLGSVRIAVEKVCFLRFDAEGMPSMEQRAGADAVAQALESPLDRFGGKLNEHLTAVGGRRDYLEHVLLPWLQVHRFRGRKRSDYPRAERHREVTIFNYHTALRQEHARGRKQTKREPRQPTGLTPLGHQPPDG